MLIEFRFSNFRSFKEEQTFSLNAYARQTAGLDSHCFETGRADAPYALKAAAIFGPNASGKSNLLKALQFMQRMVRQSPSQNESAARYLQPFLFDSAVAGKPSSFEATLFLDGVRYQYGFSLTTVRVESEYLLVYEKNSAKTLFERTWIPEKAAYQYRYSSSFRGTKKVWEETTRPEVLYLSTATALNSAQLKPVFDWFDNRLVIINDQERLNPFFTIGFLKRGEEERQRLKSVMSMADLGVDGFRLSARKVSRPEAVFTPGKSPEIRTVEAEVDDVVFQHRTSDGIRELPLQEESAGTQTFFAYAGPVLDILDRGITLCVDELDRSLHPVLVKHLVEKFIRTSGTRGKAQLIFTTHCDALLENETGVHAPTPVLRRDQVWFTQKDGDFASQLYSLVDFKVRKNESVRDGYWRGRFDALPLVADLEPEQQ